VFGDSLLTPIRSNGELNEGAIANGATLYTSVATTIRAAPAAAVTGLILAAGIERGQEAKIVNASAFSMTMAAAGTSNVAAGVLAVVAANTSRLFIWDTTTNLWY
jgi:hypothetical protein